MKYQNNERKAEEQSKKKQPASMKTWRSHEEARRKPEKMAESERKKSRNNVWQ